MEATATHLLFLQSNTDLEQISVIYLFQVNKVESMKAKYNQAATILSIHIYLLFSSSVVLYCGSCAKNRQTEDKAASRACGLPESPIVPYFVFLWRWTSWYKSKALLQLYKSCPLDDWQSEDWWG